MNRGRGFAVALALAMLGAAPASAQTVLADFDARSDDRAPVRSAVDAARDRLDARLGDQGAVVTDPRTGAVRSLSSVDEPLTGARDGDAADVALDYVRAHLGALGMDASDLDGLRLAARYTDVNGITHVTWHQTSHGLVSYDSNLSVNLGLGNRVLNVTGSPVHDLSVPSPTPQVTALEALSVAKEAVGGEMTPPAADRSAGVDRPTTFANGDSAHLVVLADTNGDRLAWSLTAAGPDPLLYEVVVDAVTGRVLARRSLTEFANQATVYDNHPGTGQFAPHTVDLTGPDGTWLNNSAGSTRLWGANAHAYSDEDGSNGASADEEVPAVGGNWNFTQQSVTCSATDPVQVASSFSGLCTWNGNDVATAATNRAQGTTQLFYFVNNFHDWLEADPIGFTPASHNFEGDDYVRAEAQDNAAGGDFNNANMSTPPDGVLPRMQMYLDRSTATGQGRPAVSSADDASIVYHEYTHGLSNRLANNGLGGGLASKQAAAMGEGWSDFFASDYLVEKGYETDSAADGDVLHGDYTNNDTVGIGREMALDCPVGSVSTRCAGTAGSGPGGFTAGDVGRINRYVTNGGENPEFPYYEEHSDGEVWAQTLWDLRAAIGGPAARRLVAEGLRLSPIGPSMLDERDAILLADAAAGGTFHDQIWAAFAKRGFGVGASTSSPSSTRIVPDTAVPALAAKAGVPVVSDPAPGGDGDGAAEPGETVRIQVPLRNLTKAALPVSAAQLSSAQVGVVVGTQTVDYGSIASEKTVTPAGTFSVTLPTTATCGVAVPLSLKVTPSTTLALSLPTGARMAGATTAATGLPKAIADNTRANAITSTVNVPTSAAVNGLRVHVTVDHSAVGQLNGRLTGPDGTQVLLFERPGLRVDGTLGDDMDVDFDDLATQSIQARPNAESTVTTGAFRPVEPLSAFAGKPLNGTWTLRVYDAAAGDTGSLTAFSITPLSPACSNDVAPTPSATATAPTATPTPSVTPPIAPFVSGLGAQLRFSKKRKGTLAFTAGPAGAPGTVAIKARKAGRRRAFVVGGGTFVVPATGAVRVALKVSRNVYRKLGLRPKRRAAADAVFLLGGQVFKLPVTVRR